MRFRRWYLNLALVLAVLAGQQVAFVHVLSHLAPPASSAHDKPLPHSNVCGACVLSAHLGAALPSAAVVVPIAQPATASPDPVAVAASSQRLLAFRSRAPPARL